MPTREVNAAFSAGISKHYGLELKEYSPTYVRIFHTDTSDAKYVDEQMWETYGLPVRKDPGLPGTAGETRQSFGKRYVHDTYYLGDIIPDEDWDDDKYGVLHRLLPAKGGGMAAAFAANLEIQHANMFINTGYVAGTNVAGSPDGVSLFNTAHPMSLYNTTTWSNRPSVEVDLSIAGAQAAATNLRTQKAPNNAIYLKNEVAAVVINPSLNYVAKQVYKSGWERNTADRNVNYLPDDNVEIITWPYFTLSGATGTNNSWFVIGDNHYLRSFMRAAYKIESDHDIYIQGTVFAATQRFSFGWSDPRGVWGSKGI